MVFDIRNFWTSKLKLLHLGILSQLLQRFVLWLPSLLVALIICCPAWSLADFIKSSMDRQASKG